MCTTITSPSLLSPKTKKISKYLHSYYWNYHFGGQMQIHWERWPRFYFHLGPWSSRSARRDRGWMNSRRVREELALRIQNGGLTTRHYTKKRHESFLIWPTFDRILTFKWVKVSISFNFMFFFTWSETIRVDPSTVDPTRIGGPSWSGPTFVPAFSV